MGHLILQGDNTNYPGFSLLGETNLAITMVETGFGPFAFNDLPFLVLAGTTSVSVVSKGVGGNLITSVSWRRSVMG